MHYWRLLLFAFLAVFQPITSFTARNLVDGRQQCCDRQTHSLLQETRFALYERNRYRKPISENHNLNYRDEVLTARRHDVKNDDSASVRLIIDRRFVENRERDINRIGSDPVTEISGTEYRLTKDDRNRRDTRRTSYRNINQIEKRQFDFEHFSGTPKVNQNGRKSEVSVDKLSSYDKDRQSRFSRGYKREIQRIRDNFGEFQGIKQTRKTINVYKRLGDEVVRSEMSLHRNSQRIERAVMRLKTSLSEPKFQFDFSTERQSLDRRIRNNISEEDKDRIVNTRSESRIISREDHRAIGRYEHTNSRQQAPLKRFIEHRQQVNGNKIFRGRTISAIERFDERQQPSEIKESKNRSSRNRLLTENFEDRRQYVNVRDSRDRTISSRLSRDRSVTEKSDELQQQHSEIRESKDRALFDQSSRDTSLIERFNERQQQRNDLKNSKDRTISYHDSRDRSLTERFDKRLQLSEIRESRDSTISNRSSRDRLLTERFEGRRQQRADLRDSRNRAVSSRLYRDRSVTEIVDERHQHTEIRQFRDKTLFGQSSHDTSLTERSDERQQQRIDRGNSRDRTISSRLARDRSIKERFDERLQPSEIRESRDRIIYNRSSRDILLTKRLEGRHKQRADLRDSRNRTIYTRLSRDRPVTERRDEQKQRSTIRDSKDRTIPAQSSHDRQLTERFDERREQRSELRDSRDKTISSRLSRDRSVTARFDEQHQPSEIRVSRDRTISSRSSHDILLTERFDERQQEFTNLRHSRDRTISSRLPHDKSVVESFDERQQLTENRKSRDRKISNHSSRDKSLTERIDERRQQRADLRDSRDEKTSSRFSRKRLLTEKFGEFQRQRNSRESRNELNIIQPSSNRQQSLIREYIEFSRSSDVKDNRHERSTRIRAEVKNNVKDSTVFTDKNRNFDTRSRNYGSLDSFNIRNTRFDATQSRFRKESQERNTRNVRYSIKITRKNSNTVERLISDFHFVSNSNKNFDIIYGKSQPKQQFFEMNWQYMFYTLQGIYICGILMHLLTENGSNKNKMSTLSWWTTSQRMLKVD